MLVNVESLEVDDYVDEGSNKPSIEFFEHVQPSQTMLPGRSTNPLMTEPLNPCTPGRRRVGYESTPLRQTQQAEAGNAEAASPSTTFVAYDRSLHGTPER